MARVAAGFIDQSPQLASLTGFGTGAVCLPFFAAEGGHVADDIPAALAEAGFQGRILPPVGLDPRVPALIAAAITTSREVCITDCRWRR
jgi:sirohydrochlorin ferrochelatase